MYIHVCNEASGSIMNVCLHDCKYDNMCSEKVFFLNFKIPSCILELLSLSVHVWPNVLHDIVAHYVCVHVRKVNRIDSLKAMHNTN